MQESVVTIARSDGYDEMSTALRKGIEAVGGLPNLENMHIVIKSNLCAIRSSESGATVPVALVRELIVILNEKTNGKCRISVVESDGEAVKADRAFNFLGYTSLEEEFDNVKLVNLSKEAKMRIVFRDSKAFDLLDISKTLIDMEYMISVAKLKTHVDQRMSCILKNQFGLITRKNKAIFHPFLSQVIFDLNSLFRPDLCIVDGIIGMEGLGPTGGRPKRANVIIVGTNSIATDMVAARIMGFKPKKIPHLKFAIKNAHYKEDAFSVVGVKIQDVCTKFAFIPLRHYLLARFGLRLQKWSNYVSNIGNLLQKARSVLVLVGWETANRRIALSDMIKIAKEMIFKLSG